MALFGLYLLHPGLMWIALGAVWMIPTIDDETTK